MPLINKLTTTSLIESSNKIIDSYNSLLDQIEAFRNEIDSREGDSRFKESISTNEDLHTSFFHQNEALCDYAKHTVEYLQFVYQKRNIEEKLRQLADQCKDFIKKIKFQSKRVNNFFIDKPDSHFEGFFKQTHEEQLENILKKTQQMAELSLEYAEQQHRKIGNIFETFINFKVHPDNEVFSQILDALLNDKPELVQYVTRCLPSPKQAEANSPENAAPRMHSSTIFDSSVFNSSPSPNSRPYKCRKT